MQVIVVAKTKKEVEGCVKKQLSEKKKKKKQLSEIIPENFIKPYNNFLARVVKQLYQNTD